MFTSRTLQKVVCKSCRSFSTSTRRNADFTHAVVGGGVIGLAVARRLQARDGASTVLIERHGAVGTETSSRNSEVIHAGLYYGKDSLKTEVCIRGKNLLYELCKKYDIPHRNTGKWIVAQDDAQLEALQRIHTHAQSIGVPTHFISKDEAQRREPSVRAEAGVLESPTTGIVDSHSLMQYLEGSFTELGGLLALHSPVINITPIDAGRNGWTITIRDQDGAESSITADTLINSAGLAAIDISNMILPPDRHITPVYAKGTYYSYAPSSPKPSTLIYPAPVPGHGGLGTHLTLDMGGRIRFGPDLEWTTSPTDYTPNEANLPAALEEIATYLPGIDKSAVTPDYVGIRPKLGRASATSEGGGFVDFWVKKEEGFEGFVNLLGMESPGLTSSLAVAERVEELLYR